MRYLFIHQNFPGQFRHVVKALADVRDNLVVAVGNEDNLNRMMRFDSRIRAVGYKFRRSANPNTHHYIQDFETHIRRGQAVAKVLLGLRNIEGFYPDTIVVHPGWGEGLFIRDVYPESKIIAYAEFYYHGREADVGFDPEFSSTIDDQLRVRIKNSTQIHSLVQADQAIAPTKWQKSRFPIELQPKIEIIHEGIDTQQVLPEKSAWIEINKIRFKVGDEIVTYVARNLEPYRGFHTMIRSLSTIQKLRPDAYVVIVGGDDVSYGKLPPKGKTYRQHYCNEVQGRVDWRKVFFVGNISYADYLKVLQVSAAHVYLTYPFVLSWSLLEAMSAQCVVIASNTPPVSEVIKDGSNGYLVNFFDPDELAQKIVEILATSKKQNEIRRNARQTVISSFDLHSICLPRILAIV